MMSNLSIKNYHSVNINTTIISIVVLLYIIAIKYKDLDIFFGNMIIFSSTNIVLGCLFISLYLIAITLFTKGTILKKTSLVNILIFLLFFIIVFLNYKYLAIDFSYGTDKLKQLFILFLYFAIPLLIGFNKELFNRFLKITFIINCIYVILFLLLYKDFILTSIGQGIRLGTEDINPIWLARILGENIIITMFVIKNKKIKIGIILFHCFLMLITGSKGPILALILLLFLVSLPITRNNKITTRKMLIKLMQFLITLFVIIIFITMVIEYIGWDFIYSRIFSESGYASDGRLNRYAETIRYIQNNPLFGIGFGNWGLYFNHFLGRSYPHNIIIETLSEVGLVGFIPIFYLLIMGIRRSITSIFSKKDKFLSTEVILSTLFLYFLINSMISGDLGLSNKELFVYLSILLGARIIRPAQT